MAWRTDPDIERVINDVVREFMMADATLFEQCTAVCSAIRRRLPESVRRRFNVHIVMGLWDARFTNPGFRSRYVALYEGVNPANIAHEWLAFSEAHDVLDVQSVTAHHMVDPTYIQFVGGAWSYAACWCIHPGPHTWIERVIEARRIDPAA